MSGALECSQVAAAISKQQLAVQPSCSNDLNLHAPHARIGGHLSFLPKGIGLGLH